VRRLTWHGSTRRTFRLTEDVVYAYSGKLHRQECPWANWKDSVDEWEAGQTFGSTEGLPYCRRCLSEPPYVAVP